MLIRGQFEAFPQAMVNVRKHPDLPPEDPHHRRIYEFTPRPAGLCPPLGPNFLQHRIKYPDHAGNIVRCCQQFPKKLLGAVDVGEVAWGLHFDEGLDKTRLSIVVICGFLTGSLIGCVVAKITGSLQSGFAVASYFMATLAVGLCSIQLAIETLSKQ